MELEMEFDKNFTVGQSPNTVLPTPRHRSHVEKRSTKGKFTRKDDDLLSIKEDFVEISFRRYRSASCKSVPSRFVGQKVDIDHRRGSVYQSSKEVRQIKKMSTVEGRRKIEMPQGSDTSFSCRIVDSCNSDEESPQNRSSDISLKSNLNTSSVGRPHVEPCSSDSFIEIFLGPDNREKHSAEAFGEDSVHLNLRSDPVAGPLNNGNELLERDQVHTLHKSLSAKVENVHSPSPSESDHSSRASSKVRFSPIRKMFDPFMKSKSLRSPSYVMEPGGAKTTGTANMTRNRAYKKPLLPVSSNTAQNSACDSQFSDQDKHQSVVACSPVHLHGHLKIQNKHGMPYFEFSLKCSEDVFVARTWKADNAFNWVYTFHSIGSRKKSNASGRGLYGSDKDSSMVGQMQVSCYLCSELKDDAFDNSMVTEFVLYDISHARQTFAAQENANCTPDDVKPPKGSNPGTVGATLKFGEGSCPTKVKLEQRHASDHSDSDSSAWASADLHPNLEIAAIVMQVPCQKRESLKYKRGDKISDKAHKNLLNLSMVEQKTASVPDSQSPGNLKVIIPAGNHGFPTAESRGPSSLLDRWRLGGGCDCGGWDMSCPLIVLSNPHNQCTDNQLFVEKQQPLELFVQGAKENTPALTMTVVEEGQYSVHFHAQLSTLQAFSICVAILHGTDTSAAATTEQERNKQLTQCNSLKVLIEEEVKFLIEAVTAGEKKKVVKRVKGIQPFYLLNPPFSPIARV